MRREQANESQAKRELCPKARRIVETLQSSGMPEDQALATEMEIGKIYMVGCTTFRDETNKVLMRAISQTHPTDPEEARRLAKRLSRILAVEKQARISNERVAQNFYTNLFRA